MIRNLLLSSLAALVGLSGTAFAQTASQGEPAKRDPKAEDYDKAIKDLKKLEGNFTFYLRKKEILLELPESRLGQIFLVQAAFNTGPMTQGVTAGFPVGDFEVSAFRFDRNEDQVWLVRPNIAYRWQKDDPLAVASSRAFPEAILGAFRIEQTNPEKKLVLINFTNFFFGDVFRLNEMIGTLLGGPYMLDREKSGPEKIKAFPENSTVQMRLNYFSPRGGESNPFAALLGGGNMLEDDRSAPIKVTFNMWFRKPSTYMPRLSDPRVGYFTTDFFDVSRFLNDDRTERYINRFHLEKKDPDAKLSEPVKPITWYIDTSVPAQYREAMKAGVLYWNKAFEALGYKNAIEVKNAPEDDPDWDHADGRYNVVRWTMSEDGGYAITLDRTDPFTGEILNTSVSLDANLLYLAFREQDRLTNPGAGDLKRAVEVLSGSPEKDLGCSTDAYVWDAPKIQSQKAMQAKLAKLGWHVRECEFAKGEAEQASFAWNGLIAAGGKAKISKEDYAKAFLTEIVSHEVGHTMGLRHNFIASTRLSTVQLADDSITNRVGITSSVMDYVPTNILAVLTSAKNFYTPTIGEYDVWAIKYGYLDVPDAKTPAAETDALAKVAALSGMPEHRYMSDEQADSFDPYAVRFDQARDPVTYSARVLEAANNIKKYAIEKLPKPGESYAKRTEMILSAVNRVFREGRFAARFVGGIAGNKSFKSDSGAGESLRPVSAAEQRQAMRLVTRSCLTQDAFALPKDVLMNMSQDYNTDAAIGWTAPLRDMIGAQQAMTFAVLMSASATKRIAENQYKWGKTPGAYTIDEHFSTLLGAVFSEIGADQNVPALRRDLQRFALNGLMIQAGAGQGGVSEDVRMLATDSLRRLTARMGAQLKNTKPLDAMTQVHLRDSKEAVDRFLARQQVFGR